MKRLTERPVAHKLKKQIETGYCAPELIEGYLKYIKLAAYEDTGIAPEEVQRLKEEHYRATDEASDLAAKIFKTEEENVKLCELLKMAVKDMENIANKSVDRCTMCFKPKYREICANCNFRWKDAEKAKEVLKDE